MSDYEIYVFILCMIVFCLLGGLSTAMLIHMYKQYGRLIDIGAEDKNITTEYHKKTNSKSAKFWNVVDKITSTVLLGVMCAAFVFALVLQVTEDDKLKGIPSLKVVKSASMSYVHEDNDFLTKAGVTDRIQIYDLVTVHELPGEFELELYDIVVYEADGITVIHRIVDIEEPNEKHPDCRYFVLQGDANNFPDKIPVYYSQMTGIYKGERIPFVGTFVMFMQSPAGWMCIILVVVCSIVAPIMGRRLENKKKKRLIALGVITAEKVEMTKNEA